MSMGCLDLQQPRPDMLSYPDLTIVGKETTAKAEAEAEAKTKPTFLNTIFPMGLDVLPFSIPKSSVLREVGATPLMQVDGVYAKLEGCNHSGSIKDRAVLCTVLKMFEKGTLQNGSTLVLITSGSAGVSLLKMATLLQEDCGVDLRTVVICPKAYESKEVPARMAASGMPVFYDQADADAQSQLLFLDGAFADVVAHGKDFAASNGFAVLDQHYDVNGMMAHQSTANELMAQMPDLTDVTCSTGSGATAAGLRAFLPKHVTVHAKPSVSGTIDGLGNITKYNNFCVPATLAGYADGDFDPEIAKEHQHELRNTHGIQCGPSSGATMWLAQQVKAEKPNAKVAFISADGSM